jgi:transposase
LTMTRADLGVGVTDDGLMGPRSDQPKRRTFTAEYKLAMVAEYDAATEPGAKGTLLRREGLYSSHIIEWRRARGAGALAGVADKPRKPARSETDREAERLRAENERLRAELAKTRAALDVVGKAHALLGLISESADTDPRSTK